MYQRVAIPICVVAFVIPSVSSAQPFQKTTTYPLLGVKIIRKMLRHKGQEFTIEQFKKKCRGGASTGDAGVVRGEVTRRTKTTATLATRNVKGKLGGFVTIDDSNIYHKCRVGHIITVWGVLNSNGTVVEYVHELDPPPGLQWRYSVSKPRVIVGSSHQKLDITGALVNRGKATYSNVKMLIRMYQTSSPNDHSFVMQFNPMTPGKTATFNHTFNWYNFQYAGATSVPKHEVRLLDYTVVKSGSRTLNR